MFVYISITIVFVLFCLHIFIYVQLSSCDCNFMCVTCVFMSTLYFLPGSVPWIVLPLPSPLNLFQVRTLASAGGPDNLVMLDPGKYKARPRVPEPAGDGSAAHPKWQVGEQEYEALMRMLDNLVRREKTVLHVNISKLCFH